MRFIGYHILRYHLPNFEIKYNYLGHFFFVYQHFKFINIKLRFLSKEHFNFTDFG